MVLNLEAPAAGRRRYGWVPDLPDHRDFCYAAPAHVVRALPESVDLRPLGPASVYDQGDLSSCTGNAIAAALEFDQIRERLPEQTPSRLFIYYNERVAEKSVNMDGGAQIRNGIKSVAQQGACSETLWPYHVEKVAVRPTQEAFNCASQHRALVYQHLPQNEMALKSCLASGYPFVFGFSVYDAFESDEVAKSGILNLPAPSEKMQGGHAVLAVGYNNLSQRFLVRNSWGKEWGEGGHFWMPYPYVLSSGLADDFWVIKTIQQ